MDLEDVKKEVGMVIESVDNIQAAYELKNRYGVDMPIVDEAYNVLYNKKSPVQAAEDLMTREKKNEYYC